MKMKDCKETRRIKMSKQTMNKLSKMQEEINISWEEIFEEAVDNAYKQLMYERFKQFMNDISGV